MATDDRAAARKPSDEEIAQIEVGQTSVSPATVRLLLAFFLTTTSVVPVVESMGVSILRGEGVVPPWAHLSSLGADIRAAVAAAGAQVDPGAWDVAVSANHVAMLHLSRFERALESESLIAQSLRPHAQRLLTALAAGNERVYPGRDGWLFYRQDVEYLTGPGFLDPAQIETRTAADQRETRQPDPRPAIVRFGRDLAARGITLVVMPVPVKPGVHPERLARRHARATGVLENPASRAFAGDLRREGVLVFDPSETLAAARRDGPQYLATDTHWRPESMELVAERLGAFILAHARLPATRDPAYRIERSEARNTGDVARMLDLPDTARVFPPEAVWLRRVLQPDGSLWRSSREADVLVLGDSFTNIYSLESMGWGTSAGFAEQLSYVLARPVDRLVQNDEGAFATRAMLQRDPGRLAHTRVVVWQFAARELAFGDWRLLGLPDVAAR